MYRILVTSDWHCGNKMGLTPPKYQSEDNEEWLAPFWGFFTKMIDQVGEVDVHAVNGDMIDGPQPKNPEVLIRPDINDQVKMAVDIARMVPAKKLRIIKGTGYHTDKQMSFEQIVADELGVEALDEWPFDVNGCLGHLRHVVGRSDIPYGQYTQDAKELTNEVLQAEIEEYPSAELLGRAHVHYCTMIGQVGPKQRMRYVWTNPALQLRGPKKGAFSRRLRTWLYHVGATLLEIDTTGESYIRPIIFPIKLYAPRRYECLTGAA